MTEDEELRARYDVYDPVYMNPELQRLADVIQLELEKQHREGHAVCPPELADSLAWFIPFLHVYAQPTDDAYLHARQDFGTQHPWFGVTRVPGRSHFPNIEQPAETAAAIKSFVNGL